MSAVVVVAILGLLAVFLFNRSNAEQVVDAPVDEAAGVVSEDAELAAESDLAAVEEPAAAEAPAAEAPAAEEPAALPARYDAPPPMTIDPERDYTATITTPRGDIVVELLPNIAPQTVNNFVFLANEGFYNGLTWHRVLPDFMAQAGDPLGDGTGDAGYNIPAEFTSEILFDRSGILAMARSNDPNSASSQFFITTASAPHLNEQYTIFGEVIEGQEIVDNIPLRDPMTATAPGEEIISITIDES
ncbi:MAG: peptidylprolyl isomerase [Chloroflexaceae bacterium]|nr:peptidylprolyl isomerase [Chloroflexaceae bacterium]